MCVFGAWSAIILERKETSLRRIIIKTMQLAPKQFTLHYRFKYIYFLFLWWSVLFKVSSLHLSSPQNQRLLPPLSFFFPYSKRRSCDGEDTRWGCIETRPKAAKCWVSTQNAAPLIGLSRKSILVSLSSLYLLGKEARMHRRERAPGLGLSS